jgi:hypothetical protein
MRASVLYTAVNSSCAAGFGALYVLRCTVRSQVDIRVLPSVIITWVLNHTVIEGLRKPSSWKGKEHESENLAVAYHPIAESV